MRVVINIWLVLLAALVLLVGPSVEASEEPCRGEKRLCSALIAPEVIVRQMDTQNALEAICGFGAKGCAHLHAGFTACTVYLGPRATNTTKLHEMNHCRGWDHKGNGKKAHRKPWAPFEVVERWLLKQGQ